MNAIDQRFQALRNQGRKALIPFVAAGDPNLAGTGDLVTGLVRAGADLIEIGFPYSDPLADGPVIQASYTRALRAGLRLESLFAAVPDWVRAAGAVPLVAMVAFSLIHRRGVSEFLALAQRAGFAGLIVPDLPLEEADELAQAAADRELRLVQLVTPTTPPDRAARIVEKSSGFLYVVSVTGITGERTTVAEQLAGQLAYLRTLTSLPLCVGFGISTPEQARQASQLADGVIVGSALVKLLETGAGPWKETVQRVENRAAELAAAIR